MLRAVRLRHGPVVEASGNFGAGPRRGVEARVALNLDVGGRAGDLKVWGRSGGDLGRSGGDVVRCGEIWGDVAGHVEHALRPAAADGLRKKLFWADPGRAWPGVPGVGSGTVGRGRVGSGTVG